MLPCVVQGIQANVGALINDTVGVLAAVRYIDGTDTIASVIMGTGKPLQHLAGSTYNHTLHPCVLVSSGDCQHDHASQTDLDEGEG